MAEEYKNLPVREFSPELIRQGNGLADLTDDQVKSIMELGNNIAKEHAGQATRTAFDSVDAAINISGIERNYGENTSAYVKRVAELAKQSSGDLKGLKDEIKTLKEQIASGDTSAATKKELSDLQQQLKDKTDTINGWESRHSEEVKKLKGEIETEKAQRLALMTDIEFNKGLDGVTFKEEAKVPKAVRESYIKTEKAKILEENTIETVEGQTVLRNKQTGEILKNPNNNLHPFTLGEYLVSKIGEVIEPPHQAKGTGIKGAEGKPQGSGDSVRFSATSQQHLTELGMNYLKGQGVAQGTREFQERLTKIFDYNEGSKLPRE